MTDDRHELRSKGAIIALDAVIAMMDLGLKPTEIVAILTEKASHLAWDAARGIRSKRATAETAPGRASGPGAR